MSDDEVAEDVPALEDDSDEDATHDAFGYPIEKSEKNDGVDQATDDEEEDKPAVPAEKTKKVSGYGDDVEEEPAAPVEPPKELTPEELTAEAVLEKEYTEVLKDIGEGYDVDKIKTFAKVNKFTPEQLKAYKELTKSEDAEAAKQSEAAVKAQRSSWLKELKTDKEFGGVNFETNIDRVEKLVENHMPHVKKLLTEKGGMLPPSFMRDLLTLAKAMNPKSKFVGGSAPAPKASSNDHLADLYK